MRVREVTMQQDGARCHNTCKKKDGLEAMTQKLNAAGAKLRPRITYHDRDTAGVESRR